MVEVGDADERGVGVVVRREHLPELLERVAASVARKFHASDPPPPQNQASQASPQDSSNPAGSSGGSGGGYMAAPVPLDLQALAASNPHLIPGLPPVETLHHALQIYIQNNRKLLLRARALKERDGELERMYRKVVSLCTGVETEKVIFRKPGALARVAFELR